MKVHGPCRAPALFLLGALLACDGDSGAGAARPDDAADVDAADGGAPPSDMDAADPSAGSDTIEVSGRRLKVIWAQSPTGARSFGRWFDSQLQTSCSFKSAEDGELRCLPTISASLPGGSTEFSDPYCTRPALVFPAGSCPPAPHVGVDVSNLCQQMQRIHQLGERLDRFFALVDGTECLPFRLQPGQTAYDLGVRLPAETFVRADVAPRTGVGDKGPLQVLLAHAEDGARYFAGWWNRANATECLFLPLADGGPRCFAELASVSGGFLDAGCTQQAASYTGACGGVPPYVAEPIRAVCPIAFSIKELGARQETPYLQSRGGSCQPASAADGVRYHAIGATVDASGFPRIDYENEDSTTRLRRRYVVAPEGQRALSAAWFDADRGDVCVPVTFGEKVRCAPQAASLEHHYADRPCSEPLLRAPVDTCPQKYAMEWNLASCPERPYLHLVGARHTGTVYAKVAVTDDISTTIECVPVTPEPKDVYYRLSVIREEELSEMQMSSD